MTRDGFQGLAEWSGELGGRWARAAGRADEQFDPLTAAALEALTPTAGQALLDVGCGTGGTTALLARLVQPGGSVVAIDPGRQSLELARAATDGLGVELLCEDAASYGFAPASFDGVFSRLGVMFFEDPAAAFANLHRATKPGGILAFTFHHSEDEPWVGVLESLFDAGFYLEATYPIRGDETHG